MNRMLLAGLVLTALLLACSPTSRQAPGNVEPLPRSSRTLVTAHRYEPANMAPKVLGSNGPTTTTRLFNAVLTLFDNRGAPQPYLAESLPQLTTDTWRVLPDGRMETMYRLRPNLTWHDGAPLTAADFAFALRVYKDPELGVFIRTPQGAIEAVQAADPRTVLIQWRSANPDAGTLTFGDLDALPSHLLEPAFVDYQQGNVSRDAFLANPFWTGDFVGAGPFHLDRWEPGLQMEGTAFDGHVLGRPKIDRLVVRFIVDENTTLATVLAGGQLDYTQNFTLRFEHLLTLRREWEPAGKGTAAAVPGTAVYLNLQQRPDYVGDEALLDVRVRRALAHAIDREALIEGIFNGLGFPAETPVPPAVPFYPDLERAMTRYPLDPNRSAELMAEAGFTRDAEGLFATAQGRRFRLDFTVQASPEIERMQTILSDTWRRAGFNVQAQVMGVQQFTELRTRHTLPGLAYSLGPSENSYIGAEIGSAANGWAGLNRTGWTNPDFERLYTEATTTLDQADRGRNVARMMAIVSEYLPGYPLYFSIAVRSRVTGLQGPDDESQNPGFGQVSKATTQYWNIQDWTFA